MDITDKEALLDYVKRFQIDTIINCAAYTNVKGAETDYEGAYAVNVKAIENLCATDCKIIHISTDYVFDGEKGDFYTEEDETNPLNVYGKTKREGEEILMKLKPDSIIIRTCSDYHRCPYRRYRLGGNGGRRSCHSYICFRSSTNGSTY